MNDRAEKFADLYTRGLKLLQDGADDAGMQLLYEAAKTAPDGWLAVAIRMVKEGLHEEAMARLHEVLKLTKNAKIRAAAFNNIGMIHAHRGDIAAAVKNFESAASLAPEFPDPFSNIALCRKWSGDLQGCIRMATRALQKDPWHAQGQFVRAMAKLLAGEYLEGFEEYECRWRSRENKLNKIVADCPEWDGHNGTRLLIYGEQGHGDSILMMRYARLIRERGLHQTWVLQKPLTELAKTIPDIDRVFDPGTQFSDYDCHLPAASLPRIFKTTLETIPPAPYIPTPSPSITGDGFHVGVCWRGSKSQANDAFRSTRLEHWRPVLDVPGITFHSLQVDDPEEVLLYPQIICHEPPKDFLETAQRMAGLDLVISVDTSVVHLAGALGVPCWCALHCRPYFVFPPHMKDATPWYRSVKLYRQEAGQQWPQVFARIAEDLCRIQS